MFLLFAYLYYFRRGAASPMVLAGLAELMKGSLMLGLAWICSRVDLMCFLCCASMRRSICRSFGSQETARDRFTRGDERTKRERRPLLGYPSLGPEDGNAVPRSVSRYVCILACNSLICVVVVVWCMCFCVVVLLCCSVVVLLCCWVVGLLCWYVVVVCYVLCVVCHVCCCYCLVACF